MSETTAATTEAPTPIEYHDKYVDLKSGEQLYYLYQHLSTALWRQYVTDLDACMNSYQLFAKVKLEAVRLDAFLGQFTLDKTRIEYPHRPETYYLLASELTYTVFN